MTRTQQLVTIGLLLAAPITAGAQVPAASAGTAARTVSVDRRWEPWLGCWSPAARADAPADAQVCIVPSPDGVGVRRITFAGDSEVLAESVVADGTAQTQSEKDCTGTRASRWSTSGAQLFFSSELKCPSAPTLTTTGLAAMIAPDQWLDVQTVVSDRRGEQTRVQRFWRASAAPPAPVASTVAALTVRNTALPRTSLEDVIDASKAVSPSAVEAWLSEGAIRLPVQRQELVRLSDAQVNGRVIDLMVALAYPQKFEVHRASSGGGGSALGIGMPGDFYPYEWGILAGQGYGFGYGYGYGVYGSPYFFGANPNNQTGGFYIVPGAGGTTEETTHGQVVNGQGYTHVQLREPYRGTATASGGGSAQSSSNTGGSASNESGGSGSSSSSSGSSGASPSGYSGGGGGSTGVTAVPR